MMTFTKKIAVACLASVLFAGTSAAQEQSWTLKACIDYALEKNISVQKANIGIEKNERYIDQAKASRLPSVSASARQNFSWEKQATAYDTYKNTNSTSLGLSSSMSLYNGGKLNAQIEQTKLQLASSALTAETVKESVSLSVAQLYLQVLYAKEQVTVAKEQASVTEKQLILAEERLRLGDASKSDYLQIKSSLSSDKLTLANAESTLALAKVDLMQMMELPVSENFEVDDPQLAGEIDKQLVPSVQSAYAEALAAKPEIKNATLNTQSAQLDQTIAKAGYFPTLSLDGSVGTSYSGNISGYNFSEQLNNHFSPALGLTLSIPIFQNKQTQTSVAIAKLSYTEAQLTEIDTRNQLRKEVEQACVDVSTGQVKYRAGVEQLQSNEESYQVAAEKYNLGMLNAVDLLFQKNSFTEAQSQLLQNKYNLLFAYKILDFYKGIPLN
ncbi:MAG: TolC family protein [Breznakibacter sp.]